VNLKLPVSSAPAPTHSKGATSLALVVYQKVCPLTIVNKYQQWQQVRPARLMVYLKLKEPAIQQVFQFEIPTLIDDILQIDPQAFLDHVLTMNVDKCKLLFARVSELQKGMDDSLAKFLDIPPNVIAANVFPFIQNRTG
jgi:hypothetical protein